MIRISLSVDGAQVVDDVEPRLLLSELLHARLGRAGTVSACDTCDLGACLVRLDGTALRSCTVLAVQADGAEVWTTGVEPLALRDQDGWCSAGGQGASIVRAKELFGYDELRAEQRRRLQAGDAVLLGIGVSTSTEPATPERPRGTHLCAMEVDTETGALSMRRSCCGDAAAATPAGVSAVIDALRFLGVSHLPLPVTPELVWRAINGDFDESRWAG